MREYELYDWYLNSPNQRNTTIYIDSVTGCASPFNPKDKHNK